MRYLLAARNRAALVELVRAEPLLAFDYDGTLSPLTLDRDEAFMRPGTRELLSTVAALHRSVIVTGRSRADMTSRVAGVGLADVIGNHGMEPSPGEEAFERVTQAWVQRLEPMLRRISGAELENKRLSLSVHYWRSSSPNLALRDILFAAQQLGDAVHIVRGHNIVNLIPRGADMKSGALLRLMRQHNSRRALFAGDDWTDEEAFEAVDHSVVMTVRIGRFSRSGATYYLRSQNEIDDLLDLIRAASVPGQEKDPASWRVRSPG